MREMTLFVLKKALFFQLAMRKLWFGNFAPISEEFAGVQISALFLFSLMSAGPRRWQFEFRDSNLTHFGGMVLVQRFCQKIRLRWRLQRDVPLNVRQGLYWPADLFLALLYAVVAGLRRINKTEILQYNGTFLNLLGLDCFPDQSTLRRFLKALSPTAIRQLVRLHDRLRRQLFLLPQTPSSLIFDLDSVVITVYGKQQGARVGYNPKKKGRRSYHPLLCFEATRHEFWHGSLRPGNTSANTGVVHFMRRCLAKLPAGWPRSRIRVRADSGFFGNKFISSLEELGCEYVIVAKMTSTLRRTVLARRFQKEGHGLEFADFDYQCQGWKEPRRFVAVRRLLPTDKEEEAQLSLFKDRRYAYQAMVTNLRLEPFRLWRFYVQRATIEQNIRELLYDYPLGKIPTDDWVANVAFFQLLLLTFDVMHWFKRLCLPPEYLTTTLESVRTDFLVLPAKLVRRGHRNILQLPEHYHHRQAFLLAWKKVNGIKLPKCG
jgi:hypothetical protein